MFCSRGGNEGDGRGEAGRDEVNVGACVCAWEGPWLGA
jgi:hypothetical protein